MVIKFLGMLKYMQLVMDVSKPIKVLHRLNWKNRTVAPCTMVDEYSIDGGKIWMSRAAFHQWHDNLIDIEPLPTAKL